MVGGIFRNGWLQKWTLGVGSGTTTTTTTVVSVQTLVNASSQLLNWPHSVAQDPCTRTLLVANADDNAIMDIPCDDETSVSDSSGFASACSSFGSMQTFSNSFSYPLGLHTTVPFDTSATHQDELCSSNTANSLLPLIVVGLSLIHI